MAEPGSSPRALGSPPKPGSPLKPASPIEAADPGAPIDDDEFTPSEFNDDEVSNASTSVLSSIFQHSFENGRRYHRYRNGRYPIPNDDIEQNRDDMKHAMMLELTDGKLFFAPIGDKPQKIIDLGTGTGIWAVDVADTYPSAEVLGLDLSPIQPPWVPPNVKFIIDDIEDEWMAGDDWDMVHMRCICPWLKNQAKVLQAAYDHLKPGGWIEIQEFDGRVNCDDGTVPPDSPLKRFYDLIPKAMGNFGMRFNAGEDLEQPLKDAGFVNVSCKTLKVPFGGTWPKDKTLRLVGMYCQHVMSDLMGAMAAKPFRTLPNMNEVEIQILLTAAKKSMVDPAQHAYVKYLFWTAQKPESP